MNWEKYLFQDFCRVQPILYTNTLHIERPDVVQIHHNNLFPHYLSFTHT